MRRRWRKKGTRIKKEEATINGKKYGWRRIAKEREKWEGKG